MPSSIRARVTAGAAAAVLLVLVVAAIALVMQQRRVLTEGLDEALATEAALLVTGDVDAVIDPFVDDDAVATVVDARGRLIATTEHQQGDLDGYRVLTRHSGGLTITVAAPADDIDESVAALSRSLAVAVPVVTALLAALVWVLVGRTLRPVEAIRSEVASIGGRDLHRRVPVPATGDEVSRLARTMNEMLGRVEDASARQARFVADASHELRTPLARMRAELEVDLAHPDGADLTATHRSALEEIDGLHHLVDDLLALARADAGVPHVPEAVDLKVLVRGDDVVHVDAEPSIVHGSDAELRRAVGNLVDNARRHARSRVDVVVRDGTITVEDDGPGVPLEHRERVFERFSRVDESRSAATGGAGLGLAIARATAERHGGTLTLEGANRFVLRLPTTTPR